MILALGLRSQGYGCENPGRTPPSKFSEYPPPIRTRSWRLSLSKSESPASHPSVTRLFQCGAIESPASRRKMRVLREAVLARGDWPLLLVSYIQYLLACQKSQRSTPYNIIKNGLPWKRVFRRRHLGRRVTVQSPAPDGPPCFCDFCLYSIKAIRRHDRKFLLT